jgi:hypothetical protein
MAAIDILDEGIIEVYSCCGTYDEGFPSTNQLNNSIEYYC